MKPELLYGFHAVREALRAGRRDCRVLWLLKSQGRGRPPRRLTDLARARRVEVRTTPGGVFRGLQEAGVRHQGVALEVAPWRSATLEDVLTGAADKGEPPLLLILDHVQDPQNVGAMLRICDACGAHGAICARRRAAPLSPAVSHASAGAMEHLPVVQVANVRQAMDRLRDEGVWLGGLEGSAGDAVPIGQFDLDRSLGLVVGSEGAGLSRLVRDGCDFLLRLAMHGQVESFNAASAVAIAMYLARQSRSGAY